MKTEIDRICGIMYTLLEHQPVIDVPYEKINDIAVALVKEGYGKISEYKAEIERLRTTLGQCNTELNSALESLKSQCREIGALKAENETYCKQINQAYDTGYNDGYDSCQDDIKQAQIDVLNKLKKRARTSYVLDDFTLGSVVFSKDIDELIKEVQNG